MATVSADASVAALATTQAAMIDQQPVSVATTETEADEIGMQTLARGMATAAMPDF